MTQKKPSMQDVIRRRQQEAFVGREDQMAYFREQLTLAGDDSRRRFVVNVWGQGGVGKTTLLKEFGRIAREQGAVSARTDEAEKDAPAAMARLVEQLKEQGRECRDFAERYKVYRQRRDELEADPDAPQGLAGLFGRTVTRIGAKVLRNTVPGSDLVLDFIEEPVAEQVGAWTEFVRKKLTNRDEQQLVLEPERVLSPLFIKGLETITGERRAALFFDTYEHTCAFLDSWLRAMLEGRHGELPTDLTLVISGREELERNDWSDWEGVIARLPLEPFSDGEARDYLARKGVTNEQVVEVILSLSGRLPLLLATLAAESPNDPAKVGDATGTAVERFLKWVDDPVRRELALNCALPRRLNRDVVEQLGGEAGKASFEWLIANPFIERKAGDEGWTYHEVVRTQMLRYKRQVAPKEWAMLHEALTAHYQAAGDSLGLTWKEGVKDATWRAAALGALYHRLCAHPEREWPAALNEFVSALDIRRGLASEWAATLEAAGQDAGYAPSVEWGRRLGTALRDYEKAQYQGIADVLDALTDTGKLQLAQQVVALAWQGEARRLMGQYPEAIAAFDSAIKLDPEYAWAVVGRGEAYRLMGEDSEALTDYCRAIELDPKSAEAFTGRGLTYHYLKEYSKALTDFDRAIQLDPQDTWAMLMRSMTYAKLGQYSETLADLDCAIRLDSNPTLALALRGALYASTGKYIEALSDIDSALKFDSQELIRAISSSRQSSGWRANQVTMETLSAILIAARGETQRLMSNYPEALVDFDRAIELNPQDTWAITNRGETYRLMEMYPKALADFDRAIELDSQYAWAIASRGKTYHLMEKYPEALADFDRAIQLDPEYKWAIAERGETYRLLEMYPEALADFDRAIELDPEYKWAIANRGETYRLMEIYPEALADFKQVLELDSEDDWAHYQKGIIRRVLGDVEGAIEDISTAAILTERALERTPTNYRILFNLALYRLVQGQEEEAESLYRQGVENANTKQLKDAIKDLEQYLTLFPGDETAITMLQLLAKHN